MATDKSEPRTGLIFRIGLIAVLILVALRGFLVSYFDGIASAEEHRKFGEITPTALINLREDEKQRLSAGPMPIEKAMADMVAHGRNVSPDIAPSASRDVAPLQGWSKMPGEVPPAMTAPPPSAADAGAPGAEPASTGDAGAPKTDGGAPKKPIKK